QASAWRAARACVMCFSSSAFTAASARAICSFISEIMSTFLFVWKNFTSCDSPARRPGGFRLDRLERLGGGGREQTLNRGARGAAQCRQFGAQAIKFVAQGKLFRIHFAP